MSKLLKPADYNASLDLNQTEQAIKNIKDFIEKREDNITKMTKWINKQF